MEFHARIICAETSSVWQAFYVHQCREQNYLRMNSEVQVYAVSLVQTAFTRQKNFGKEAREAQWATAQRTLHGLHPPEFRESSALAGSKETLGGMADQAKRRAEIARFTQHLLQFFGCSL
jgi:hypothetical protein